MENQYGKLIQVLGEKKIRWHEPLSQHTTFRIGGPADLFFEVNGVFDLIRSVVLCREMNVPFVVLGGGSNVLVADRGFRGVVISNRRGSMELIDREQVEITSGLLNKSLVQQMADFGLAGLEFLVGIPGTIGGAIRNNARFRQASSFQREVTDFPLAQDLFVADRLEEILILTPENRIQSLGKEEIHPQHHKTKLKETHDIILSGKFRLQPGDQEEIQKTIREYLVWRKTRRSEKGEMPPDPVTGHTPRQPHWPNPGCIFSNTPNPENHPVGRMLDMCGLKGKRMGNIMIAPEHANYMVNLGDGKAADVLALIRLCQEEVRKAFGIDLELEVDLIGEF